MSDFLTAYQAQKIGGKTQARMIEHVRRLRDKAPRERVTASQWEMGRKWLDIVRPRLHSFKHPRNEHHMNSFMQTLPIPDSGSLYVDQLCLDLAGAILTRRANINEQL